MRKSHEVGAEPFRHNIADYIERAKANNLSKSFGDVLQTTLMRLIESRAELVRTHARSAAGKRRLPCCRRQKSFLISR